MPDTATQSDPGSFLMPSLAHAAVADAMHPGILSCTADARLIDVARTMANHHVHCVVVMGVAHNGSEEPLVWGIISDLDLIRAGVRNDADESAGALAQQPIISVKPNVALREAAELMLGHGVSHLVVIDPEKLVPIGILSSLDVAGVLAWGEA
jgi:CBS domain-containing protein